MAITTVADLEKNKIYVGTKYVHPKYGEYTITKLDGRDVFDSSTVKQYCIIRFTNTKYEYRVKLENALKLEVKDPYYPEIAGVGYFGEPDGPYELRIYNIWNSMIDRCYDPKNKDYHKYGARGVTVDKRWHCFANFLEDFDQIEGYKYYSTLSDEQKQSYHLDKDFKQPNEYEKVYSKDTCCLVKCTDNVREAMARYKASRNDAASKFIGVRHYAGVYQVVICINNIEYYLGAYNDEIAAANVYNYVANQLHISFNNGAPYMEINVALSHCVSKNPISFPDGVNTEGLNIPYRNHSKYYGVKKKRNNFYGLYHNKDGSQHIGIYDDEIAAASAHNIYMRLFGDGIGHYNKESDEFHEMSLAEVMMHRTYTKATEPKVMIADVDKETHELTWYTEYTYKTKFPPVKADAPGRYTVKPIINGVEYHCGIYSSKEAAICLWAIINRYFNLCYDKKDITMTLSEALSYKFPMSVIEWPEGFDTTKWDQPLPLRVFQNQQQTITPMAPVLNAAYNTMIIQPQPIQMYHLVNQDEETRRINNLNKYGVEFL